MPWVNVVTGRHLKPEERTGVAQGVAEALNDVVGKDPAGVFVSFTPAEEFYWGGAPSPGCSIFDVRWIGEFSTEQKSAIAARICGDIGPAAGIDGAKTRVVFTSKVSEDWGRPTG